VVGSINFLDTITRAIAIALAIVVVVDANVDDGLRGNSSDRRAG
jgi:hypothetical protein